jgi:hypothetical protein
MDGSTMNVGWIKRAAPSRLSPAAPLHRAWLIGHYPADRHREEEPHHAGRFRTCGLSDNADYQPSNQHSKRARPLSSHPDDDTVRAVRGVPLMIGAGVWSEIRQRHRAATKPDRRHVFGRALIFDSCRRSSADSFQLLVWAASSTKVRCKVLRAACTISVSS